MNLSTIAMFGAATVASYFVGQWAMRADSSLENLRRRGIRVSQWLNAHGLTDASVLVTDFVVSDWSGLIQHFASFAETLDEPAERARLLNKMLTAQLAVKASSTEGRDELLSMVGKALGVKIDAEEVKPAVAVLRKEPS